MTRRRKIILSLAALSAMGLLLTLRPRDPVYGGRTLSSWLDDCDYGEDPAKEMAARNAIREIGPAALPQVMTLIRSEDSNSKLIGLELLKSTGPKQSTFIPAWRKHWRAATAFNALGPLAKPAVPELARLLPAVEQKSAILHSLASIGPGAEEAVPAILPCLKDSGGDVRCAAAEALGSIALRPELAVPALINALDHPQPNTRWYAAEALGAYGETARSSVPALLKLLDDSDRKVRTNASNALLKIDPAAITRAGGK